jgi:2-desacetyl-2-hydroxyethyl bacteriochlorophyllide A dehydrogenase
MDVKGKAVVFTDRNRVSFQAVDIPEPGPRDVTVDVRHSWISIGTESSFLRGERIAGERAYLEGDPWPFPHAAGYQKTGIVRAVGAEVPKLKPGDAVFVSVSRVSGLRFAEAGHIQPAVSDCGQVWKLPDDAGDLSAYAGLVLTQVGYNCGMRAALAPGDAAVVIGDGLVGHWAAQTLVHRGAEVVMLGRHDSRLRFAEPPIRTVNVKRTDAASLFGPGSIAAVVDTVGAMDFCHRLRPSMKRDSHLVSAGYLGTAGLVDIQQLREQEITLHTPSGWTTPRMDATLEAVRAGWLKTLPLITHRYPAEQAEEAWKRIAGGSEACLGVLLDWQ